MDHRIDCQLLTVPTYGLCTCDFDKRLMERDAKDFAIEHAGYLATAAEQYLVATDGCELDRDGVTDAYRALRSAIHEFRKRAARAAV